MPQRRVVAKSGGAPSSGGGGPPRSSEILALAMESNDDNDNENGEDVNLVNENGINDKISNKNDDDYEIQRNKIRIQHWRESPFAVGLTEPTWIDEQSRGSACTKSGRRSSRYSASRLPPDETGCLCFSAYICPLLNAERVGNMIVLKSTQEWVDEVVVDEETGEETIQRYTRPKINIVVGPYWPMLCLVTYPLILGVSFWTYIGSGIRTGDKPIIVILIWFTLTIGLIVALAMTACRDPGILYRTRDPHDASWRWSDQADSYRPRDAWFDSDTAVIVEGFDHTCPWTGTAIGKRNFFAFQMFVCLVFVCMIMDIFLLTGAL